jgi:5-methyltetrahydropteroyltriglutamate--homocysteine methyltransferase
VDQIDLELSNSQFELFNLFKKYPFTKEIGLGVVDVHSHKIETKEQVANRIKKTIAAMPIAQIYVSPDCGLKTRSVEEAKDKLRVMMEGTLAVRESLSK